MLLLLLTTGFLFRFSVPRNGTDTEEALKILEAWREHITIIPLPRHNDASSTKIRRLLAEKKGIDDLTTPGVVEYIQRHGLYAPSS